MQLQLQRSTAVWKLLQNISSQPTSLSQSTNLFVSVSEIYVVSKKKLKQRFQSLPLKGINSAVSLLNCFKESVCTDAIMYEGWRKQLCYKVTVWEAVWDVKIRTEYKCMQHWCISMLFASQEVTSPPPAVLLSLWSFFILSPVYLTIFTLSAPMRLCSWHRTWQHWPQAVCFFQYDLFIPMLDGNGIKSTTPNQFLLAERERKKASGMINSILNTLSPRFRFEKKSKEKERGRKKNLNQ